MVSPAHERLQVRFAAALQEASFTSWVGDSDAQTGWMVRKWGDVYPHETLIAHLRRLLDQEFVASKLSETPAQFKQRLQRVEDHLNSAAFAAPGGTGLLGLAKELRPRCQRVVDLTSGCRSKYERLQEERRRCGENGLSQNRHSVRT